MGCYKIMTEDALEELFKSFDEEDRINKEKSEKVLKIIDEVLPINEEGYTSPYDAVDVLARVLIGKFQFTDMDTGENKFIEMLMNKHIESLYPKFKENIDYLENYLIENKEESFGDADLHAELLINKEDKIVIHLRDVVTCSNENEWLIIHDKKRKKLNVRTIWDKYLTDNKNKNKYINKPDLKWWKERNFSTEYSEQFHMTHLSGMYGDTRDKGYVLTYNYSYVKYSPENNWYFYTKFVHVYRNISWAINELKEQNDL